MFSSEELSDGDLSALFHNTSWIHRKSWQAFPKLFPVPANDTVDEDWPSIILHGFESSSKDVSGIFYANAFENVISVRGHERKICIQHYDFCFAYFLLARQWKLRL
jgi:prenylcysteine oxidase/farnesylcysteine lyase